MYKKTLTLCLATLLFAGLAQAAEPGYGGKKYQRTNVTNASNATAGTPTTAAYEQQYAADKQTAETRYLADKKLCDEETASTARMQCRRDANDLYQQALTAAEKKRDSARLAAEKSTAAATAAAVDQRRRRPHERSKTASQAAPICNDCGQVIAVQAGEQAGKGGAVGAIAGGVAGALLGRQIGKGHGKDLATIAGAVGGAYAGHTIEGKMDAVPYWTVSVRFENGSERSFTYDNNPQFAIGDKVKLSSSGNSVVRY